MIKKVIVVSLVSLLSLSLQAEEKKEGSQPCKTIKAACESAGFIKGGHKEKKGLIQDCMKPILAGNAVAGVTVNSDEVTACNAKKAARKAKKEAKK